MGDAEVVRVEPVGAREAPDKGRVRVGRAAQIGVRGVLHHDHEHVIHLREVRGLRIGVITRGRHGSRRWNGVCLRQLPCRLPPPQQRVGAAGVLTAPFVDEEHQGGRSLSRPLGPYGVLNTSHRGANREPSAAQTRADSDHVSRLVRFHDPLSPPPETPWRGVDPPVNYHSRNSRPSNQRTSSSGTFPNTDLAE